MYLGVIVETAPADDLFYAQPIHPYREALLSAIPDIDTGEDETPRKQIVLEGEVPSPISPPSGCRFHTRCPYATEICRAEQPPLADFGNGRFAACHHPLGGVVPIATEGVLRCALPGTATRRGTASPVTSTRSRRRRPWSCCTAARAWRTTTAS